MNKRVPDYGNSDARVMRFICCSSVRSADTLVGNGLWGTHPNVYNWTKRSCVCEIKSERREKEKEEKEEEVEEEEYNYDDDDDDDDDEEEKEEASSPFSLSSSSPSPLLLLLLVVVLLLLLLLLPLLLLLLLQAPLFDQAQHNVIVCIVPPYSRAGVQLGHNWRRQPRKECGLDSEKSDGATPRCRARNDSFVYVCRNGYHIRFFQFSLPRAAHLRGRQRTALKIILYVVALTLDINRKRRLSSFQRAMIVDYTGDTDKSSAV
ncbi:hypothetical protein ElyMa_003455400 [Elysia marginata]|uniref:SRCR domain-containing protein n=1 Tax=Elysia marginata TaxID=1093978 RepID=A0AAV4E884_9GAST|nr:hypothetical protein ElyMa_003455400 [Elysia marginata]